MNNRKIVKISYKIYGNCVKMFNYLMRVTMTVRYSYVHIMLYTDII